MPTVLVTGASSGFGLATARLFLDRGWTVAAAMRVPQEGLLPASDRLRLVALDVTDPEGPLRAAAEAGPVDVLVNNAGIGFLGAVEGMPAQDIRDILDTNLIGAIAMAQAVLPRMRERRSGTIVHVTSSVTLAPIPLLAVYTASKAALSAFSAVLSREVEGFGVRVREVLPGRAPSTPFGAKGRVRMHLPEAYRPVAQALMAGWQSPGPLTTPDDVAEAVWRAANDEGAPERLPAGVDAEALMP
ncbi:SDR family NAD(P)-dependent oxidoreductase [Rubellimicrobium rubrum]|uniref:SDR family NAD(P)-dependent oxidoreductase n=1 Tax=Rubellimicrobium rubrum TaxID=2585369 RepID=A0A5C4MT38_9RHOB|nr:SDR family NAD(P)-dependent oxidoreductase [Rubellimicrobium rubrum]TNC47492.1 SDR family NAD(P)-dependent oxidoreductase [Rubellimicrobium rubrum]